VEDTSTAPMFIERVYRLLKAKSSPFLTLMALYGIDIRKSIEALRSTPRFVSDFYRYRSGLSPQDTFWPRWNKIYPVLSDFHAPAGSVTYHYFYQDLWAARKIFQRRPLQHIDIGSRLDGFVAHLLTFMPVIQIDIRQLPPVIPDLTFIQDDATEMRNFPDCSVESLSCLHAAEHFGLGRYGDPIAPDAWLRLARALARVLKPGGHLYYSVPLGVERVEFNAHRVFAPQTVLSAFSTLRLASFAAIDDGNRFHPEATPEAFAASTYSCGLFEFTK